MRDISKSIKADAVDIVKMVINDPKTSSGDIDRLIKIVELKLKVAYSNGQINGMHMMVHLKEEGE